MTTAKVLADSINEHGQRIVAFQVRAPRFILSQLSKHRELSISCRSSRAVPVKKMIDEVVNDPVIPRFGRNQSGMRADALVEDQTNSRNRWLNARDQAVRSAYELTELGVAKETTNRLLEPFAWFDAVISSTNYINLFALRIHPDAQHEIRELALAMARAYRDSKPVERFVQDRSVPGGWHLPYVTDEERAEHPLPMLQSLSAARCGRVSYVPHGETAPDIAKDMDRAYRMQKERHAVPFEHVGCPGDFMTRSGNFKGWHQWRQTIPGNVSTTFDWSLVD